MTTEIVNYQKASKRSKLQKSTRSEGFEITELLTINQHDACLISASKNCLFSNSINLFFSLYSQLIIPGNQTTYRLYSIQ